MSKNNTRLLSLLLCLVLLCTMAAGCAAKETVPAPPKQTPAASNEVIEEPFIDDGEDTGPEIYSPPERTVIPFNRMTDNNFDEKTAYEATESLASLCCKPHTLRQLKEAYDTAIDQFDRISTDYNIVMISYYENIYDESRASRQSDCLVRYSRYTDSLNTAIAAVLDSPYREAMIKYINSESIIDGLDEYESMDDEYYRLKDRENELIMTYYDLSSDTKSGPEDFCNLYLQFLDTRIALNSYDQRKRSTAETYYSDIYSRDYLPRETADFCEWVKEYIVPLESDFEECYWNYGLMGSYSDYYWTRFTWDKLYPVLLSCLNAADSETGEYFSAMNSLGLIDFENSDTKSDQGFTSNMFYYGVPYIFIRPSNTGSDAFTMIHEFGHSLEYFVNSTPAAYNDICIDIAEIDSQGLEMLMLAFADYIYGEDARDGAVYDTLLRLLNAIIDGCIFDEFQQKAFEYRQSGLLADAKDVEKLFIEIEDSYRGGNYGFGANWYMVSHTFDSPFYYISYATSAVTALNIMAVSTQDWVKAKNIYIRLIDIGGSSGYVETLVALGLSDPMSADGQKALEECINLDSLILSLEGCFSNFPAPYQAAA